MVMLAALCILFPLVAALETCDETKGATLLSGNQLEGDLLGNFAEKKFWLVSVSTENAGNYPSAVITFDSVSSNTVPVNFVYYDSLGAPTSMDYTYTLNGDHITSETNSVYFFKCSDNLIAGYRCQDEGTTGGLGPSYFVWAEYDTTEDVVSGELESCHAKFVEVESSTTFIRRTHP